MLIVLDKPKKAGVGAGKGTIAPRKANKAPRKAPKASRKALKASPSRALPKTKIGPKTANPPAKPPKAFLFDMDGTLVDTFSLIHKSFNTALKANGKRQLTEDEFNKKLFGKPVDSTLERLVGPITRSENARIMGAFEREWLDNLGQVKVFKNVPLTLGRLKRAGCKLGVVSTSPRDVIKKTLEHTGIRGFFDVLIGEEDAVNKKPHHEPVTNALKALGTRPDEAVFVGDTIYDIQAGKSAGCYTVFLVNAYNGGFLQRARPDRAVRDVSELLQNG